MTHPRGQMTASDGRVTLRDRLAAAIEGIGLPCTCGHLPPHPTGHGRKTASDFIERDGPALLSLLEAGAKCREVLGQRAKLHYSHGPECWCKSPDMATGLRGELRCAHPDPCKCSCDIGAALALYSNAERESEK